MDGIQMSDKGLEALLDLEMGIQSKETEIRVQSFLRFTNFFKEYPDPLLVNNAILKISDYWWTSDNLCRQCILSVFEKCERHLSKITSEDEILRRILSVLSSNDPIAKAFTLRLLGTIAHVVKDRVDVHHKIRLFLCKRNYIELNSAIYVADKISAISKEFSEATFPGLELIIKENKQHTTIVRRIIYLYRNMYHTDELSQNALFTLMNLITTFENENIHLSLIFKSMTTLSLRAIYLIPTVTSTLIDRLKITEVIIVQDTIISSLRLIFKAHPHRIDSKTFFFLINYGLDSDSSMIAANAFNAVVSLCTHSIFLYRLLNDPEASKVQLPNIFLRIKENVARLSDSKFTPLARLIYTLYSYYIRNAAIVTSMELKYLLETLAYDYFTSVTTQIFNSRSVKHSQLKSVYYISLVINNEDESWNRILSALASNHSIDKIIKFCIRINPSIVVHFLDTHTVEICEKTLVAVITNYIRYGKNLPTNDEFNSNVLKLIGKIGVSTEKYWYKYLIACEALVSGNLNISLRVFETLKHKVSSETCYCWVYVLINISKYCQIVNKHDFIYTFGTNLNTAIDTLWSALIVLRSLENADNGWDFQIEYLKLIIEIHTNLYYLNIMVQNHAINNSYSDLNLISSSVLIKFVKRFKKTYSSFNHLVNTCLELEKRSMRVMCDWANFCSLVSDLLEIVISQKQTLSPQSDDINSHDPSSPARQGISLDKNFVDGYKTIISKLTASSLLECENSEKIVIKNVVQFVIAILKSIDVIPRVFYKRNVKKQISTDEYMQ